MTININSWISVLRRVTPKVSLHLTNISKDSHGITQNIFYVVKGKSIVASDSPENLVDQLLMLNGFSKKDSFDILTLLNANKKVASKKIKSAFFEKDIILLEIVDTKTSQIDLLRAADILAMPDLEKYYSCSDIVMIYCYCLNQKATEERNTLKNNHARTENNNIVTFANEREQYGI